MNSIYNHLKNDIFLYLSSYLNQIKLSPKEDLYAYLLKAHLSVQGSNILNFILIIISPFRIIGIVTYSLYKMLCSFIFMMSRKHVKLKDKKIYLLFNLLLIEKVRAAGLYDNAQSWLIAPYYKKRPELFEKEQFLIYDFITIKDSLYSFFCVIISFFLLITKYDYKWTIYHYRSFDFFLVLRTLKRIPSKVTIIFPNQCDRWSCLFNASPQTNKILFQHGIVHPIPLPVRFTNVNTLYAISETEAKKIITACFEKAPQNLHIIKTAKKLTPLNSSNILNILIISYSPLYVEVEKQLIKSLCNLGFGVYVKLHPTVNGNVYAEMQQHYFFKIIDKPIFPDVDIVISYESTLAIEYKQLGKTVLYHTELNVEQIVEKINKKVR